MLYHNTLLISDLINPIRKIPDQEKSDSYICEFLQSIKPYRCLKLNYMFFIDFRWLEFQNWQAKRMIVLENLNWLYAARDKTWSNFKLFQYLHWVKETLDTRLCQIWTGLHTDWRLLLTVNISAICKLTLFLCTRYFFISQMSCCWEFV